MNWMSRVMGDPRTVPVERRIARLSAFALCAMNLGPAALGTLLADWPLPVVVVLWFLGTSFAGFYWYMRHKDRGHTAFAWFFAASQLVVYASGFPPGGLDGPGLYVAVLAPTLLVVIATGWLRWLAIAALTVQVWGMLASTVLFPDWYAPIFSPAERAIGVSITWTIGALAMAAMVGILLQALRAERRKNEELLLNVLPASVAERLKREPDAVVADHHEDVTVIFADMVGFTPLSERVPPAEMVAILDEIFQAFDALAEAHGVEKVRTIGDAWMGVAGCPEPHPDPVGAAAEVGLGIQRELAAFRERTDLPIEVRIGMNTGPVVGGIVGRSKVHYDVWGDVVNTAARMESHGIPGAIQITEATADRLRGRYALEDRGKIALKGKEPTRAFLLRSKLEA